MRLQQCALGNTHVHQVVKTVIEGDVRVHHVDREGAEEHLEHILIEEEVHGALRLRVGAIEIENRLATLAPQRALDAIRPHAHAVIAEIVLKLPRLLGDDHLDDVLHGVVVALQHNVHGAVQDLVAKTLGKLPHAFRGGVAGRNQRIQIEAVPLRRTHVVQDEFENVLLQLALLVQLGRRDADTFLEDRRRLDGDGAGYHAAVVRHVTEHRRPGDVASILEDRHQHNPVRQVRHRRIAHIGVVGEDDVSLLELVVVGGHKRPDEGTELPHDHLAVAVGDHGKQSPCSRIPGDMAVRNSTASISSRAFAGRSR
jgi:hypothetical protein